ncbi:hypothetical protein M0R04_15470 [Candidatus Dojkabacteria bacterium]|nr:hypothetical protein [Candidatus Dojkabacteria bacterium]
MKKIICWLKGHERGSTSVIRHSKYSTWTIKCKRCGYRIIYESPIARLVGTEIKFGFDGN